LLRSSVTRGRPKKATEQKIRKILQHPELKPFALVIRSVLGTRKTVTFVSLVVLMATLAGMTYGSLVV